MENQKVVYVVCWVDLDDDSLKKSEIEIVGVFNDEEYAETLADNITLCKDGYCSDDRCHYAFVSRMVIDKMHGDFENEYGHIKSKQE